MKAHQTKTTTEHAPKTVLPGSTIGMVGGGQLGRMFAHAASQMGYRVVVFCENDNEPAAQVAHGCITGPLDDAASVTQFASQCDVITLEFENIPAETIAQCQQFAATYPSADVLAIAQHRLMEKQTLRDAGLPVAPFAEVTGPESLVQASETTGWPMILKTAVSGYDGKGQHRLESIEQADSVDWEAGELWVAEKVINFDREVSVVVARTPDHHSETFPVFENRHRNHILDITSIPANISTTVAKSARDIALRTAEALDVVGLLCVEMFVCGETVIINEVAPRPHNSGHLTIEATATSQFQQHVRAVCNLPLGNTRIVSGGAAMANLLGDLWGPDGASPNWDTVLSVPGVNLHLYGKSKPKPGRKMGHLTTLADNPQDAIAKVETARAMMECSNG